MSLAVDRVAFRRSQQRNTTSLTMNASMLLSEGAMIAIYNAIRVYAARWIAPLLFVSGLLSTLAGIVVCAAVEWKLGLSLLFCGIAAVAFSQIIELMKAIENDLSALRARLDSGVLGDIAAHLAALRSQMRKGVFGLLGM